MKPIFLILINSFVLSYLYASELPDTLNLQQFLVLAEKQNGAVKSADWNRTISEAELSKMKRLRILPKLRLKSESGIVPDAKGDVFNPPADTLGVRPLGPFNRTQLEAIQPIYPISRGKKFLLAATNNVSIAEAQYKATLGQVNYEIKKYYHATLLARDLSNLAERLRSEISSRREEVEGATSLTISSTYELNLASLEIDALAREARDQLAVAKQALLVSVGLSLNDETIIAANFLAPLEIHKENLFELSEKTIMQRPEWQELQAGIAATKALHSAALDAFKPEIYIAGGIRYAIAPGRTDQHNPFVRDEFNSFGGGIFLGVKQSLEFHLMSADVVKAEAHYKKLTSVEEGLENMLRLDVSEKLNSFHRETDNLNNYVKRRKIARQWLKEAKEEYEFDPDTLRDLIKALEKWAEIEREYFEQIYQFNLSVAALEKSFSNTMISSENQNSLH